MDRCSGRRGLQAARQMRPMRGFAYLWVLLLVALMGLGLAAAVQVDATLARRDKERELLSVGRQFRTAIQRYHSARVGGKQEYPASLDDLLRDNRVPGMVRHLRKLFTDPVTGQAEWGLVRVAGRVVGVHSLSDQVPIKQDGFEPEDASFAGKQAYREWVFTYPADLLLRGDAALAPAAPASAASAAAPSASLPTPSPLSPPLFPPS
jgi:type II secretory pathway pseudopilin PulG